MLMPLAVFCIFLFSSIGLDCYEINTKEFPSDFLFGVSTAAYQIEGAWNIDGKSENIWDNFTHKFPELIVNDDNGDVACDSYHKYKTDVSLMKYVGVTHYRFSISWSRILPKGFASDINVLGIQHYQSLIKELKANNIEPVVTLFHWDLPQVLQDYGGFLNDSFPLWFSEYARVCFRAFGDDVRYWATFNEPNAFCVLGYDAAYFAPRVNFTGRGGYLCGHNLIKGHAAAWHVYDEEFKETQGGSISISVPSNGIAPLTNSTEDLGASERILQFLIGWWANPLVFGDYPEIMKQRVAYRSSLEGFNSSRLPEFTEEEKAFINGTLDYFSLNTYQSSLVQEEPEPEVGEPSIVKDVGITLLNNTAEEDGSWAMTPLLKWIQSHYNDIDILITENGLGNEGKMEDNDRIKLVQNYLSRIRDAIDSGVKVFGYTLWSLIDTFEWNNGYSVKLGIYQVDFNSENRTRTPRASALWYKSVIEAYCLDTDGNCK